MLYKTNHTNYKLTGLIEQMQAKNKMDYPNQKPTIIAYLQRNSLLLKKFFQEHLLRGQQYIGVLHMSVSP